MRIQRTSHSRPCLPYLLIIDQAGIVQYRIDKTSKGRASEAAFLFYRTDGSGSFSGSAITRLKLEAKGIDQARSMAALICKGLPASCELYQGQDRPTPTFTFDPNS